MVDAQHLLAQRGWVQVPLVPQGVALRSARVAGREAAVTAEGGWMVLTTDRRGAFDVELEFAARVSSAEGRSSVRFGLAPSGTTQLELAVPSQELLDFQVAGAQLQSDRVAGDRRVVEAVLPGASSLSVTWQRAIPEDVATDEARLVSEVFSLVTLGEGLLSQQSTVSWTIQDAGVEQLRLAIPPAATVVDVQGAGLRDWQRGDDGELRLALNYAAEGSYRATVQLEQPLGADTVVAPLPRPLGVQRSRGWVGVEALGAVEVAAEGAHDVSAVDVRTLPAEIIGVTSRPVLLGYKYLGDAASLPLTIERHDEVAVLVTLLDQAHAVTMFTEDGRRLTSVAWRVRNNRKQFLRLDLPQGAELWSASVAGKAVQPARDGDGRILLPLVRSQASRGALADFAVSVTYVESGEAPDKAGKGRFRAALPGADVPITWVGWTVYAPPRARIKRRSFDGTLRPADSLDAPYSASQQDYVNAPAAQQSTLTGALGQLDAGNLARGATPVEVAVPLEGQPLHFEKLLALGEELWVGFDYSGLD